LAKTNAKTKSFWVAGRGYDKRVIAALPKAKMLFQEVRVRGGEKIPRHYHASASEHFFVFQAKPKTRFLIGRKWLVLEAGQQFTVKAKTVHAVDASKTRKTRKKGNDGGAAAVFFVTKTNYEGDDGVWK